MQNRLTIEKSVLKGSLSTFCAHKINPCSGKCTDCLGCKEKMYLTQQKVLLTKCCELSSVTEEERLRIFYVINVWNSSSIVKEIAQSEEGKKKENTFYMGILLFNKTLGKAMCSRLRLGEIWQTWKYEFALQTCPVFGHTMNDPPRGLFLHGATRIGNCLWEWAKWTEESNHQAIQMQIASTEEKGGNLQLWWVKSLTLVIKTKC